MELILDNYIIDTPIMEILTQCKKELTNGKLSNIIDNGTWVSIPCPFHSDGKEKNNSCGVVSDPNSRLIYGTFNCFTCKEKGGLAHLIGACFDEGDDYGKRWLISNFGKPLSSREFHLESIKLNRSEDKPILDESILDTFQKYHPYMTQRKLTNKVINDFKVRYDPNTKCIVFPVWDENDNLIFLTRRNVEWKQFYIPKGVDKPIYLLNYVKKFNIDTVVVVESQINCLTCWSYGVPSIALFGSSLTNYQRDILNRSNIRHYILALDNDDAGKKGVERFMSMIRKDVFVDVVEVPPNRDVNDLTKDEFEFYFRKYFRLEGEN